MVRIFVLLAGLAAGMGSALASLSNLVSAWGHDFAVTPFEMKEMPVAVATDRATGKRFNLMWMPNGRMMAIVPLDRMTAPPIVEANDVM